LAVSPDGRWIAYQAVVGSSDDWEIVISHPDGSGFKQLTDNRRVSDVTPRWSPDGRRIAYASGPRNKSQVYVVNADGSRTRNLSQSRTFDEAPIWVRRL
jgi:TolB protein